MQDKRTNLDLLFAVGRVFSPLYSLLMVVRAWMYKRGWLASVNLSIPVISVGNLTMGGTGKTPMVIYIARLLMQKGMCPAILSRGYGGSSKEEVNVVSDGHEVKMGPTAAGDEPVLLAKALPGVPVITGAKRSVTGRFVEGREMAEVIILDDGFQHMALSRDVNIVLFVANLPFGNGRVFPGGSLRESVSALSRADCFVVTGVDVENEKKVQKFSAKLEKKFPGKPVFRGGYAPCSLFSVQEQKNVSFTEFKGLSLLSFCGIANPESFSDTLQGYDVRKSFCYADHYSYVAHDVNFLVAEAKKSGCAALITTEKDYVKVKSIDFDFPLLVLKVELKLSSQFDDFLLLRLG